jgi:hypothetical protein
MPVPHAPEPPGAVRIVPDCAEGVGLLRLVGRTADAAAMVEVARRLLEQRIAGGHVVLDLDDLVVDDAAALCAFLARLSAGTNGVPIPVVAADPGRRRLLRACGAAAAGFACFGSRDDALAVARATSAGPGSDDLALA